MRLFETSGIFELYWRAAPPSTRRSRELEPAVARRLLRRLSTTRDRWAALRALLGKRRSNVSSLGNREVVAILARHVERGELRLRVEPHVMRGWAPAGGDADAAAFAEAALGPLDEVFRFVTDAENSQVFSFDTLAHGEGPPGGDGAPRTDDATEAATGAPATEEAAAAAFSFGTDAAIVEAFTFDTDAALVDPLRFESDARTAPPSGDAPPRQAEER